MSESNPFELLKNYDVSTVTNRFILFENESSVLSLLPTSLLDDEILTIIDTHDKESSNEVEIVKKTNLLLITPATEKNKLKFRSVLVSKNESYDEYLETIENSRIDLKWIRNLMGDEVPSSETIYFTDDDIIIVKDYKGNDVSHLKLLCIVRDENIKSLREIPSVDFLIKTKEKILDVCKNTFNIDEKDLAIYVHYKPSYYWFHIHITLIVNSLDLYGNPLRNIFVDDIIKNLKIDKSYYLGTLPCIDFTI